MRNARLNDCSVYRVVVSLTICMDRYVRNVLYDIDFAITADYRILSHAFRIQKQLICFFKSPKQF